MKESEIGRFGPDGPVTFPFEENVVGEHDLRAEGFKVVFHFDRDVARQIVEKDDGRVGNEIGGLFGGQRKGLGNFTRDPALVDFTADGIEDDGPVLFLTLRFFMA